ncbi:signal peptide peptidase domain-containing protein, putative [Eimeria maxima]|uniref:Signal peptide peptidase domain-containing protein, putative n=1 Tax=Eimeria maxima TaxID=5804 RepID=U6MB57_EIMMA|nr:signal peptide peptidase domain-containing protein, putative [Eimeria maxima]CDJ58900.1 signal peptide peptidase domain-containing protein, putative [Eimeria maxima]
MSVSTTGDTVASPATSAVAGSISATAAGGSKSNCLASLTLFYSCFLCLAVVMGSQPLMGYRSIWGYILFLFRYLAYKFLGTIWVNMLLTLYLTGVGLLALGETIFAVTKPLCPPQLLDESWLVLHPRGPFLCIRKWISGPAAKSPEPDQQQEQQPQEEPPQEQQQPKVVVDWSWRFSPLWIISHLVALAICTLWLLTKHWALHNILAIAFCIQAIALVSVGSFGVASILLCGLFVYDVIWVFGTEVMVSVAKAFEGPAKLMFPVQISPLQYSILGLGDVVIPGVLIAMCLRFDLFLYLKQQNATAQQLAVNIHQRFPKFYFCVVLSFYELGLLTTGIVMLYAQHAQPALLYLVPYCLFSLFGAAALNGKIKEVLAYKEEEEAGGSTPCTSAPEQAEKKEN